MEKVDLAVIGGGAVGCATARQASFDFPNWKILVLEKKACFGIEASGRNSGVLHSGFHHPVGSLKERLANRGSKLAKSYAMDNQVLLLNCGMLVVIPKLGSLKEVTKYVRLLKDMFINGKRQRLKFLVLTGVGVRKLEPEVEAVAGIFLPEVRVINFSHFVRTLVTDAIRKQVDFIFKTEVKDISVVGSNFVINDSIQTRAIVNCSGIYADIIASMVGLQYHQYPVRGEYYEIVGPKRNIVSRLVNPAVPPGHSNKGIHFGPRPDGRLFLGPSFKPLRDRGDYESDKTAPEVFLDSCKAFVPNLTVADLRWAYSGIRAKLSIDHDSDFIIRADLTNPIFINNIGIDSPGLSASMAIAEMNCELLKQNIK